MALVSMITNRADLPCANCGTTQTHTIEACYDTDTLAWVVNKRCKCYRAPELDVAYVETVTKVMDVSQE